MPREDQKETEIRIELNSLGILETYSLKTLEVV
jgi:hypothetical protein